MRNLMLGNAIVRPVNAARIEILAGRGSSKNVYNYRSKLSAHGTMTWPCQSRNFSILAVRNLNDRDGQAHSFSDAHFGQERDREAKRLQKRRATHTDQETAKSNYSKEEQDAAPQEQGAGTYSEADHEHAVISTFDLFSIGIGPSSSHTVGPMRAGKIFVTDLQEANLLQHVDKIRISLFGSLAATGEGHMTPSALLLGLECADVETIDTAYVPKRFEEIKQTKQLALGKHSQNEKVIKFDYDKDLIWEWGKSLPLHSNGMRLTVFDNDGTMLGTNDMFSVGGGFVVNGALSTATSSAPSTSATLLRDRDVKADDGESPSPSAPVPADVDDNGALSGHPIDLAENMYYKEIRRSDAARDRRSGADINVFTSSDAGEGQGHLSALPQPNSNDVHEQNTPYIPGDTGSESMPAAKTSQRRNGPHFHFPFRDAHSLLTLCKQHNLTIAQIVYENEKAHGLSDEQIREKLMSIWDVMDASIREGVTSTDETLPGRLKLNRRAPALYRRLTRGLYPSHNNTSSSSRNAVERPSSETAIEDERRAMDLSVSSTSASSKGSLSVSRPRSGPPRVHGSFQHPLMPAPPRRTTFPAIDYLTVYAMAVNEVNAAGGRIVTAPTNGAAGILPAVLKYTLEFQSDDAERDIFTFMLTASAVGMLYKRGATISAAEGGCMAEVGVACSMAAAGFAACMGASPDTITQAAEIGIEHNLGLTCDPIGGLVQAPCIERNALGAIKAIASANLALSSAGTQKVSLDDAIRAMRLTAQGMRNEFKETSLSGLATSVSLNIPVSVPDC